MAFSPDREHSSRGGAARNAGRSAGADRLPRFARRVITAGPRHWVRFRTFGGIGVGIFVLGVVLQALLVKVFRLSYDISYLIESVICIEASFLLNRFLTWGDRNVGFWAACGRWNAQKLFLNALNLLIYMGFVKFGVQYLVANVILSAIFMPVNYLFGHFWSFIEAAPPRLFAGAEGEAGAARRARRLLVMMRLYPNPAAAPPVPGPPAVARRPAAATAPAASEAWDMELAPALDGRL